MLQGLFLFALKLCNVTDWSLKSGRDFFYSSHIFMCSWNRFLEHPIVNLLGLMMSVIQFQMYWLISPKLFKVSKHGIKDGSFGGDLTTAMLVAP